ncbi:MAG: MBL fold metallo-hydrolase [Deltaproteobacteria bacterium]|nr:MBL fold metallo-hydrolase [Candidatus Zymogenaceae bacterium]
MERIHDRLVILGNRDIPSFLLIGDTKRALIDAGTADLAPLYLDDLTRALGDDPRVDLILFTHSHFDHIGAAPFLLRRVTGLTCCAHPYLFKVLTRDGARKTIERLSRKISKKAADAGGLQEADFNYGMIRPGITLSDDDVIDLGGISIRVVATPGHTGDSLSYFIEPTGEIFTGEAAGIIPGEELYVGPEFLSSYRDYMNSLEKIKALHPTTIFTGHHTRVEQRDLDRFFQAAIRDTKNLKEKIERYLLETDMDEAMVIARIKAEEYEDLRKSRQMEEAYVLNLTAQVRHIARLLEND